MTEELIVCSAFTGVGGMDLGLERAGMRVAMSCEFDAHRRRILHRHWPDVPCCPDIRLLGEASSIPTIDDDPESPTHGQTFLRDGTYHPGPIDMLCGGFPCQDVSVAGRRRGLAGRRTGLFFEFARCADELVRPGGLILLENVPGLLSSNGGRDFAVILATLAELGFHDVAWRVLDSRHFGVPQRRRRVFILGRRARGRFCASVLLELDGRVGNPEAGEEAWAAAASASRSGAVGARGGRPVEPAGAPALAATLTSAGNHRTQPGRRQEDDVNLVTPAITAKWAKGSGGPAGDECQNLVDDRSVSQQIDDGDLAQSLTRRFGSSGSDLPDAEGNWLVTDDQSVRRPSPDAEGPAAVGEPEPRAGGGDPGDTRRDRGDAAGEHRGRPVGQDADSVRRAADSVPIDGRDALARRGRSEPVAEGGQRGGDSVAAGGGVREDARRELRGRPRDVGGSGGDQDAQLDGAGGRERGAGESGAARLRARDERGARADAAPTDGEGDGDGAPADTDRVRAPAGLPGRVDGSAPYTFEARVARNGRGAPSDTVNALKAQAGETGKGDAAPLVVEPGREPAYAMRLGYSGGGIYEDYTGPLDQNAGADSIGAASHAVYQPEPTACVHPDAVGYDGVSKTDSVDAAGVSRRRDAGLGVINDGTSYSLKTGAPPVVGPVPGPEVFDQQNDRLVEDVGALTSGGLERQNRGFLVAEGLSEEPVPIQDGRDREKAQNGLGVGDPGEPAYTLDTTGAQAVGPVGDPEAFLTRHYTRGKDGAPADTVPALTSEMDRGDGHPMVHEHPVGFQSTLGSQDRDGIEEDGSPPIMAATPPAAAIPPTMFDASSTHGHEGVGTGRPNMAPPGESLALTSRADRYAMFGIDAGGDDVPTCPFDPLPDGPRYAAMGDAVTVNVLHWIGAKIVAEAEAHGGLQNVPSE